jgi:hypothetical protein
MIATPSFLDFGVLTVGTGATRSIVLKNNQSRSVTLERFQGLGGGFSVHGAHLPFTLGPGESLPLTIAFTPQAEGLGGASIYIFGANLHIPVTGYGSSPGQLTLSPTSLSFGSVDVGAMTKRTFTISATGGSVTISSAAISNSHFTIPGTSFPVTIAAGQSLTLDVDFTPAASGTTSGKLTFASNASTTPFTEAVTGTGVLPQHSVKVRWNASTSPVVGYNVYRCTTGQWYKRINYTLDVGTEYVDKNVVSGVTYYYEATAVNASGEESAHSSHIRVLVP